jgi:hypothetical protein
MRNLLLPLLLLCSGCTALGLAPAQTLDQKIEYAYAGVDGALQSIATATTSGVLSSTKAAQANTMTMAVKTSLDAARAAESTNATGAANDLALATAGLTALQTFLTQSGVK